MVEDTGFLMEQEMPSQKCHPSNIMSFSWAVEKSFAEKLGLNNGKCQGGMPGVK